MHACIHTYLHTYMHACIHTHIHACMHTNFTNERTYVYGPIPVNNSTRLGAFIYLKTEAQAASGT